MRSNALPRFSARASPFILLLLSACSPGMFFGGQKGDSDIRKIPTYREDNPACMGLQLDRATLSTPSFRALFHCLNGNGSLAPLIRLMDDLSDEELGPVVELGNRYLLSEPRMIYHLDQAFSSLDRQGALDEMFSGVAKLLGDGELIAAGTELALETLTIEKGFLFKEVTVDDKVLKAIGLIGAKITEANTDRAFTAGLSLAGSRAFRGLESRFASESQTHAHRTAGEISRALTAFLSEQSGLPNSRLGSLLLDSIATGGAFNVLDTMVGASESELRARTLSFTPVLTVPTASGGVLLDRMSSLFYYMNHPIPCMMGTRVVPNGIRHALREMAEHVPVDEAGDYVQRENLLTLIGMNPFCEYPPQLGQYYQALASVAETSAMKPMSRFIKALWGFTQTGREGIRRPMIDLLVEGLSLRGPAGETGINLLLPVFAELADRGAYEELVLLASLPRDEERGNVQDVARFLLEPRAELGGSNIGEVMGNAAGRLKARTLERLLTAMGDRLDSPESVLGPALAGLRRAFHANDTHPVVELASKVIQGSVGTPALYTTILKMSRKPAFRESIEWMAGMSSDGRLKSLLAGTLTMFRKFSLTGRDREIHDTGVPAFTPLLRHQLAKEDLAPYVDPQPPAQAIPACQRLSFSIRLDEVGHGGYEEFIDDVLGCLGSNGAHDALLASVGFLRANRTDEGRPFFQLPILATQDLATRLQRDGVMDVVNRFDRMMSDGRLYRLIDALPHLVLRNLSGETLMDPLIRMLGKIQARERASIQTLSAAGAEVLVTEDAPHLVRFAEELYDRPNPGISPANPRDFDLNRIKRWVYNKECFSNPTPGRRNASWETNRANEVIDDFLQTVNGWEVTEDGKPKRSYEHAEFVDLVKPLIEKFNDPAQSAPGKPVLEALLSLMRNFASEYAPEDLYEFAYSKSNDVRLTTYFYPGDRQPRIRLMSTLDLLDSILVDADFTYLETFMPDNSGTKFQMLLAEAWGDEPRARWPAEIQAQYTGGNRPLTLAEAVGKMEEELSTQSGIAGLPGLPGCMDNQIADPNDDPATQQRETTDPRRTGWFGFIVERWVRAHLYNLTIALPILRENLPNPSQPKKIGMKLLRNLFWEFHRSTPAAFRSARVGDKNNLSAVSKLVRLGLTRNVTRKLYRAPYDASGFGDLFRTLVYGGATPSATQLLRELFKDAPKPIWKTLIRELFAVVQAPSGEFLTRRDLRAWGKLENRPAIRARIDALLATLDAESRDPVLAERETLRDLRGLANEAQRQLLTRWAKDADRLRELFFYLLAGVGQADRVDAQWNGEALRGQLITLSAKALHHASAVERNSIQDILGDLRSLVDQDSVWKMVKNSYLYDGSVEDSRLPPPKARIAKIMREIIVRDPAPGVAGLRVLAPFLANGGENDLRNDWNLFRAKWDALQADPVFAALDLDAITRDVVHFFEEGSRPEDAETAKSVRLFLAGMMDGRYSPRNPQPRQADVDQWLELIRKDPVKVRELLSVLGAYAQNGDLRRLLDLAQRSITASH